MQCLRWWGARAGGLLGMGFGAVLDTAKRGYVLFGIDWTQQVFWIAMTLLGAALGFGLGLYFEAAVWTYGQGREPEE